MPDTTNRAATLHMTPTRPSDPLSTALSLSLGLVPATLLTVKGAYGIVALLVLALAVLMLVRLGRRGQLRRAGVGSLAAPIWLPFCGFFLAFLLSVLATGDALRGLDYPSRWLILLPITFAVVAARQHLDFRHFWTGVGIGAIGAGLLASHQIYQLELPRAIGYTTHNPFGNLAILLGLLCGAGAVWERSRVRGIALALAGWGGMWASLLSITRGGWPIVVPFVVLLVMHLLRLPRRVALLLLVAHLALVALAYPTASALVSSRVEDASQDLALQDKQQKATSSVGARLAMWDISYQIWREHPVFGIGPTRYAAELHRKNDEQYQSTDIVTQNVAHHEWLDAMAKAGTFGGLAVLALYASPLVFMWRKRRARPAWGSLGGMGVLAFIGAFFLVGLANTTLTNHASLIFFIVALPILWAHYLQDTDPRA